MGGGVRGGGDVREGGTGDACRGGRWEVRGTRAGLRAPGACRVRGSAHRLWSDAPLSGLVLPCFLEALAHRIAEHVETARARRRSGAIGLRASVGPTPSCSSPDRGAPMIAGGRWRGCDKPPARAPHVHPARSPRTVPGARAPRTSRALPTHRPRRAPHVHPARSPRTVPDARPTHRPRLRGAPHTVPDARAPRTAPARAPHTSPGAPPSLGQGSHSARREPCA